MQNLKKLIFIALALLAFMPTGVQAQRQCGTMEHLDALIKKNPSVRANMDKIEAQTSAFIAGQLQSGNKTSQVITIPVVVHVVYNNATENISDQQIQSQIDVLNADFRKLNSDASSVPSVWSGIAADFEIEFCLAQRDPNGNSTTGINRVSTSSTSFSTNDNVKYTSLGGSDAWNSSSYLNLWVCDLGSGLLGYAQFPGGPSATDGVVIDYAYFGTIGTATSPYDLGRTATHEVGHWLNLYHIWGDDGTGCSGSDLCSDTPNQADETYGCYTPSTIRISCSNGPDGDMWMNYMDYTDDACMYMFTSGQKSRATSLFTSTGSRYSLVSSQGCSPVTTTCSTPTGLNATSVTSSGVTLGWTAVSGASSYNIQYKLNSATTWTTTTSTTNSKSLTGLTAASQYNYKIQAVCSSSSSSAYSTAAAFTTSSSTSCGTASGLAASSITNTTATLSWNAVSGATSYTIRVRPVSTTTWTTSTSTTNSKTVTGLTASTNYEFQVRATCTSTNGAYTSSSTFTTSSSSTTCTTDAFESNNSFSASYNAGVSSNRTAYICPAGDEDWFYFSNTTSAKNIRITIYSLPDDYDLQLYNSSNTLLSTSQNASTMDEVIIYNNAPVGTYYARVYGYNNAFHATNSYIFRARRSATAYTSKSGADENQLAESFEVSVYPNPAREQLNLQYELDGDADVKIEILDLMGKTIFSQQDAGILGSNRIGIDVSSFVSGFYFIKVSNGSNTLVRKFQVSK